MKSDEFGAENCDYYASQRKRVATTKIGGGEDGVMQEGREVDLDRPCSTNGFPTTLSRPTCLLLMITCCYINLLAEA